MIVILYKHEHAFFENEGSGSSSSTTMGFSTSTTIREPSLEALDPTQLDHHEEGISPSKECGTRRASSRYEASHLYNIKVF